MMNECPKNVFIFLVFLRVTGSCAQLEVIYLCVCCVCTSAGNTLPVYNRGRLNNSVMKAEAQSVEGILLYLNESVSYKNNFFLYLLTGWFLILKYLVALMIVKTWFLGWELLLMHIPLNE